MIASHLLRVVPYGKSHEIISTDLSGIFFIPSKQSSLYILLISNTIFPLLYFAFCFNYELKQIICANTTASLRIIDAPLHEEVYVFCRKQFILKEIRLLNLRLVYVKQSLISDAFYRVVQTILVDILNGFLRHKFTVYFLVNSIDWL